MACAMACATACAMACAMPYAMACAMPYDQSHSKKPNSPNNLFTALTRARLAASMVSK